MTILSHTNIFGPWGEAGSISAARTRSTKINQPRPEPDPQISCFPPHLIFLYIRAFSFSSGIVAHLTRKATALQPCL